MIAVKIQCNCGQKYAFDVEPIGNSLPAPVACPVCGADGTSLANQFIAQHSIIPVAAAVPVNGASDSKATAVRVAVPQPAVAAVRPVTPVARVSATIAAAPTASIAHAEHGPGSAPAKRLPGQLEPDRAVAEARSKILWGDEPKDVTSFLRGNGFDAQEAKRIIDGLVEERAVTIRKGGVGKMFFGAGLICVPIISFLVFLSVGYLPTKILGLTVMVGCYGFWVFLKGLFMFLAPKSEAGDIADH